MRILYILKHFPCLSQTFVINEIAELVRRGAFVRILSARKRAEKVVNENLTTLSLLEKTLYLEHDYLYPLEPSGSYTDRAVLEKFESFLRQKNPLVSDEKKQHLADLLQRTESDPVQEARGFLDCIQALNLIRQERLEQVHCDFAEDNVKLAFLLNEVCGIPFSFKMRAYDIFASPHENLEQWATRAEAVFTISNYNRRYLSKVLQIPECKIKVHRDGIHVEKIEPLSSIRQDGIHPLNILCVSRLVEKKGITYLVDACRSLLSEKFTFTCSIVGDGPLKSDLYEQITSSGLSGHVRLIGSLQHAEVINLMKRASVFVLPCIIAPNGDRDGTPNVIIEAMAHGIPVISTAVSGIPELIDDNNNGLLVNPGQPQELTDAIRKIHNDPAWARKLGHYARQKAESHFSISKNCETFHEELLIVAGKK